jgi:molybdopterin molybdotransferase
MGKTPEFFNVQPVGAALDILKACWTPQARTETLDVRAALGRVLASAPRSPIDLPTFSRSTMDGYAVIAADTFGAAQSLPAYLTRTGSVRMGEAATVEIRRGETVEIHTGGMLPPGADAVVMVERAHSIGDEIEILAPVAPGENVVQIGEDVAIGEDILPAGHKIRPQDIGGLLAVGILTVEVVCSPRVGILSSGDELVTPDENPLPGQIRDVNAYTLAALVENAGGTPVRLGIARDTLADFAEKARAGFVDTDMLVITAGSSVSARDLTREVIAGLGQPGVLQHGLAVKPGKPTILAVCDNKPVIGLPGNPVSALLVAQQIVVPIIRLLLHENPRLTAPVKATLSQNIVSTTGREDSVPVRLINDGDQLIAEPVFGKSNLIFTLVNADGLVHIPLNSNGILAGQTIDVWLFQGSI